MQKDGCGMLVCGHWSTKRDIAQVLQRVGQSIVSRIPFSPQPVSFRKLFRSKRRKTQQVVRSIFDHVDPEIVARVNAELGTMCVSHLETLEFEQTIERRVLHALQFG